MTLEPPTAALIAAFLLAGVAITYFVMALGVRSGELVWSGRYIGRLRTEQRWWSLFYGLALIASGVVLLEIAGAPSLGLLPDTWHRSAGFSVIAFLGVAALLSLARGSKLERMLFTPILLLATGLVAWLTFG